MHIETIASGGEVGVGYVEGLYPIGSSVSTTAPAGYFDVVATHFYFKVDALAVEERPEHITSIGVPASWFSCCAASGVHRQNGGHPIFAHQNGLRRCALCAVSC